MIIVILFIALALSPFVISGIYYIIDNVRYKKASKKYEEKYKAFKRSISKGNDFDEMRGKYDVHYHYDYDTGKKVLETIDEYIERKLNIAKPEYGSRLTDGYNDLSERGWWSIIAFICGAIGILVTSILSIHSNVPHNVLNKEVEIRENVNELKQNKYVLETHQKEYSTFEWNKLAMAHNEKAKTFYIDIQTHQNNLKNPWINWFNNPAYNKFDVTVIKNECTLELK